MTTTNLPTIFVVCVALFRANFAIADERIWLKDAEINGKPVKLCFDTGSDGNILAPQAVKRLGLKFNAAPTNDFSPGVLAGDTELCSFVVNGIQGQTTFMVFSCPNYFDMGFDGLIGWYSLSPNVMHIDAAARHIMFLSKVPRHAFKWVHFSVVTNFGTLDLEVPHKQRGNGVVSIDTGTDCGMQLPSFAWHQWKESHPHTPTTLKTSFTATGNLVVQEEAWADQLSIGPLVLTNLPIMEEPQSAVNRWGDKDDGVVGLVALSRLDLIVDGKNSIAYCQPKTTHPLVYPHNRLGAVFVPTAELTNKAVALVVTGSPAYEAGVRNGDILLQVNDIPVVGWSHRWIDCFGMPPETKLYLTLQRDGKTFTTVATLRQIIPPAKVDQNLNANHSIAPMVP